MNKQKIAKELVEVARLFAAGTFKCPDCGSKVLEQTGYCVKCKKKVKKAANKEAAELWEKVAAEYGRKMAHKFHTQLLKQAGSYSDDKRLNPDEELWVADFMPVMMDAAAKEMKKMIRSNYR